MLNWLRRATQSAPADPGVLAADGRPRSPKWDSWLKAFLKGKSCIACGATDDLTGHHVVPFHVDPSRELDATNVVPICREGCHLLLGHLKNWQWWNPAVRADCAAFLAKRQTAAGRNP